PVSNVIVPVEVIVPPVNPSPAVIDVMAPPTPGAQLADTANDDEIATDAVCAYDAVVGVNVMEFAALAVTALFAQLLVPNKELVIPPLIILTLPVISTALFRTTNDDVLLNPT
ncbi:MAG: hypothetical protein ACK55I_44355, partial [bacterium]